MNSKLQENVLHNLTKPITVSVSEGDEIYEIINITAPANSAAGYHRNIGRLIAKALNRRNMDMQKNITADLFKNIQEIQKMMEQLREVEGVTDVEVPKEPTKKKKGIVEDSQVEEERLPTDDELLTMLDNIIIANIDNKDLDELYTCFKELMNTSPTHKMFTIAGYGKPITPAIVIQLSVADVDILLAKYVYFFTRLRQSLLTE